MALQVDALRSSFDLVAPQAEQLTEVFYATLFERYPGVVPLFAGLDMKEQGQKLAASIALVVKNLESPDVLTDALHGLGSRHVDYGAEEAHYGAVGECLLHALSVVAGDAWTAELEAAWTEAYGAITALMLEGASATATA